MALIPIAVRCPCCKKLRLLKSLIKWSPTGKLYCRPCYANYEHVPSDRKTPDRTMQLMRGYRENPAKT